MLQIVAKNWWSADAAVSDESAPLGDIALSWWSDKGEITIDGETYRAARKAPLSHAFVLEGPSGVLAEAEAKGVFRDKILIRHGEREYALQVESLFRWWRMVLLERAEEVGSLTPKGLFLRDAAADLPEDLPAPVRMFIVWLAMVAWRAQSSL